MVEKIIEVIDNVLGQSSILPLVGLYTLDIFARDIAIKRYWDKKIILSHGCLKAKVSY